MLHRPLSRIVGAAALASTLCLGAAGVGPLGSTPARAYPEPDIVSQDWSIDLSYQTPRAISVENESGQTQWYWYMPYMVVNNGEQPRMFVPDITIYNDRGQIKPAGQNVPAEVYPAIERQLGNDLLLSPIEAVGDLLIGEDYAKESVAIWPASTEDVDRFTIFVGGLSGETARIQRPGASGESQDGELLLRRATMLEFSLPGTPRTPGNQPVRLIRETDVMR